MKKKILILGANPETVGLIKKAKEMGFYTIVTDNNHFAFAKKYSDLSIDIDAVDSDAIADYCKKNNIENVVLGVAESLILSYIDVCSALKKKPYISKELVKIFTNKKAFKEICKQFNVPTIDEYKINEIEKISYPVIVKPADSCSSKGITVCNNRHELEAAIDVAKSYSKSNDVLIEKYMNGQEVVIYYAIQDGNPSLVGMCDRYTNHEQKEYAQLPISYIFPSKHLLKYYNNVNNNVIEMLKGIGIKNGVLFIQSFIDENGVTRFYEPGFRLNGAQEHYIIGTTTGIDGRELLINFATSGKVSNKNISLIADPFLHGKYGCKLSPLVKTGKIFKIKGIDKIERLEDVVSINPSYEEGDTVESAGTLKQIVCRFFIVSDTLDKLEKTIEFIEEEFDVLDEHGQSMKMKEFDVSILKTYKKEKKQ